jgi:hypothetical protein
VLDEATVSIFCPPQRAYHDDDDGHAHAHRWHIQCTRGKNWTG